MPSPAVPDAVLALLDEIVDGALFADARGQVLHATVPLRASAELLGLRLEGVFVDRLLELADRTSEPYGFAAAVGRLRDGAGRVDFEDAALGRCFRLDASPARDVGRVWMLRDVTEERERARLRDERVAAVGHELRTPLTSMAGFIELLEDGGAGPLTPDQARYLEIVGRAADRLQLLVDELLAERSEPARLRLPRS
ncbi:MAG TPA: histidine kinase dimerization/phospho-acceptor domain-containing protein [Gaiellaceae bacterium]